MSKPEVTVFCDGSASNLLGDGGWGAVLLSGKRRAELSGSLENTNSQRAEVQAAISALNALKCPSKVTIHSDSKYLVRGSVFIGVRAPKSNGDLWSELESSMEGHEVRFEKVTGHAGVELNERAHELAYAAYRELAEKREQAERKIVPEWKTDEDGQASPSGALIDFAAAREKIKAASIPDSPATVEVDPEAPKHDYVIRIVGEVVGKGGNWKSPLLLAVSEAEAVARYHYFCQRNSHLECVLKKSPSGEVVVSGEQGEAAV